MAAAVMSPAFQRMLRVSDLSNMSGNMGQNNLRGTPDTQENSHIFYQSTDGHDLNTPHNLNQNRQLNIDDDDELIEIRPDGADDNQLHMFRDQS